MLCDSRPRPARAPETDDDDAGSEGNARDEHVKTQNRKHLTLQNERWDGSTADVTRAGRRSRTERKAH